MRPAGVGEAVGRAASERRDRAHVPLRLRVSEPVSMGVGGPLVRKTTNSLGIGHVLRRRC
eukprot:7346186-Alexandrium_andersonii.AAC.1